MRTEKFRLHTSNHSLQADLPNWRVAIALKEIVRTKDDDILITPECANNGEVDYWCDKLVEEINNLRSAAKSKIRRSSSC